MVPAATTTAILLFSSFVVNGQEASDDPGEVSLSCTGQSLTVTLSTQSPFTGRLFSQSGKRKCQAKGRGGTTTQLEVALSSSEELEDCGLIREVGGYSMVVVVQHHPVVQRSGDRAVQLYCFFNTGDKVVTNNYDVIADTIDGGTQVSTPSSVLNDTAEAPAVRLRITTSDGEDISGTKLGQKLFLRIEMDRKSIFGIFAKSLKAISGIEDDEIDLLDERGCPTDPVIFPGLQVVPGTTDLQGSFEAFKFSDTSVVRFQVNVQFCVGECTPVDCGDGIQSYGRRKRRDVVVQQQKPPPQDVLYSTPLTTEIYVESGAKVATVPSTRLATKDEEVFLLGPPPEGSGELVCTTLPVIIATGAALLFLQLCIIATCLLCICSKKGKRHERSEGSSRSDHLSEYSSSTAGSDTLYHHHHRQPATSSHLSSANTLKSLRSSYRD